MPFNSRPHLEKVSIGRQHLVRQLLERGEIVENPDRSAMCSDDQIVLARMNLQVKHRNSREIVLELLPILATIKGDKQTKLRSGKQQVLIAKVFHDDMDSSGIV